MAFRAIFEKPAQRGGLTIVVFGFRGGRKIAAENGYAEAMDTKYRCKACEHTWTEREPVKKATKPA